MVKAFLLVFVGSEMCMKRAIPKWFLKDIFKLDLVSENPGRNWTGRFKHSFGHGTDTGDNECVAPLDLFSLVGASTYKMSFEFHSNVRIELVEMHFETVE